MPTHQEQGGYLEQQRAARLNIIRQWLEEEEVDIFLGFRSVEGHPVPHGFTRNSPEDLKAMTCSAERYPLEELAVALMRRHPEATIGMEARECDERAINVLIASNQLKPERIKLLKVNCCPSELSSGSSCSYLSSSPSESFRTRAGFPTGAQIEDVEACEQNDRFSRWMYEFQKCIKCFGCRNICPVCFCQECSLEHEELIHGGRLPPETPIFHLIRAIHMGGRCVDCGLCEEACPMDIPLRLLYRKTNRIVADIFDYKPGTTYNQSPLSFLEDTVTLQPKPLTAENTDE